MSGSALRVLNRRTFRAGDLIFSEGDQGTQAFILQTGRVRIRRDLSGGRHGTLGFIDPGGIFGEMALVDRSPRMASAVAEEFCTCIVITEDVVRNKLKAADPSLRMLIVMLIRLLRQATDATPIPPDDLSEIAAAAEGDRADG